MYYKGQIKLKVQGMESISVSKETIDLRYVEQLVDSGQLQTLGLVMRYMEEQGFDETHTVQEVVNSLYERMEREGFTALFARRGQSSDLPGNLAMPRREEVFACLNRYRRMLQ